LTQLVEARKPDPAAADDAVGEERERVGGAARPHQLLHEEHPVRRRQRRRVGEQRAPLRRRNVMQNVGDEHGVEGIVDPDVLDLG
jgi:hypothetical protein